MTWGTGARRRGATDDGTGAAAVRRGPGRLFARAADPDRSSRRADGDPFPAVLLTPGVWGALG